MKTTKKASKQRPEKDIQKAILQLLKNYGILHWRQNSGMVFVGKRMIKLGTEGLPDIFAVHNGTLHGLEVKTATGKLRPSQEAFRDKMLLERNCEYHVVRSEGDFMSALGIG